MQSVIKSLLYVGRTLDLRDHLMAVPAWLSVFISSSPAFSLFDCGVYAGADEHPEQFGYFKRLRGAMLKS